MLLHCVLRAVSNITYLKTGKHLIYLSNILSNLDEPSLVAHLHKHSFKTLSPASEYIMGPI